jgi:hypothetical protein
MNNEFDELEQRLRKADAKAPNLSETVLVTATKLPKRNFTNPQASRFAITAVAGLAAISVFAISLPENEQPVIRLASAGSESQVAQESSPVAADSSIGDSLPGWFSAYEYVVSPNLSTTPGEGVVYQLVLEGTPAQRLSEFAEIFGDRGSVELEEWSTQYFPSYKLETDDSYFSLYWHGSGIINYTSKRNWLSEECYLTDEELIEPDVEMRPSTGCEPLPAVELPSERDLAEEAFETISKAGFSGSVEDITIERYQWGASGFAPTYVDGLETAIEWYISWDQTGQISNVSGHLARPENMGVMETVSPAEAVSRIEKGFWFGAAPRSTYDYSISDSVSSLPIESEVFDEPMEDIEDLPAVEEPDMEILPVEPMPIDGELEVIEVIIQDFSESVLLIEDDQGTGWLVPGYLLETDQGWFEPIVALKEDAVELPN